MGTWEHKQYLHFGNGRERRFRGNWIVSVIQMKQEIVYWSGDIISILHEASLARNITTLATLQSKHFTMLSSILPKRDANWSSFDRSLNCSGAACRDEILTGCMVMEAKRCAQVSSANCLHFRHHRCFRLLSRPRCHLYRLNCFHLLHHCLGCCAD